AGSPTLDACVANDADPGLVAALRATFDAAVATCEEMPDFGLAWTVDQAVNAAAVAHVRGLVSDALGSSPGGALLEETAERRGRRCQVSVVNAAGGVVTSFLRAFDRCTRKALAHGADGEADLVA